MEARSRSWIVRWGALAGMAAGAAFVIKVAYIFALDGGGNETVTGTLYLSGIALPLFAGAGIAAYAASGLAGRIGVYLACAFGTVFYISFLSDGVEALVDAVATVPAYVGEELPIALAGIVWLVIGYRVWSGSTRSDDRLARPMVAERQA